MCIRDSAKGTRRKVVAIEGEVFSRTRHVCTMPPCPRTGGAAPPVRAKNRIFIAALSLSNTSPSIFCTFKRVRLRAPSKHTSFAGGESKVITCGFFVLDRCMLLPCDRQCRGFDRLARIHERAHAPPRCAEAHCRQTPASIYCAVRRREARLSFWHE